MLVALAGLLLPGTARADWQGELAAGARWAQRGGVAPTLAATATRAVGGPVVLFAALDLAQLSRGDDADGVPFRLVVRELGARAGAEVRWPAGAVTPFAGAGLRVALQAIRSSTASSTTTAAGFGLGGLLRAGVAWPAFTGEMIVAVEGAVCPVDSPLTGASRVVTVGLQVGYRWSW